MSGPGLPQLPPGVSREDLPQTLREWHLFGFYLYGTAAGWSREKCERAEAHAWPLAYCKLHGIPMGRQWDRLGWLAARHARDFSTAGLADELWEVMQASPQSHGYGRNGPWTRGHAVDIAARARRFIGREDAAEAATTAAFRAWWARQEARLPDLPRTAREPGARQPGARRAGARS